MLQNYQALQNKNYSREHVALDLSKPSREVMIRTTESTKLALEKTMNGKIKAASIIDRHPDRNGEIKYINYTPKQEGLTDNSEGHQRIIQLSELKKDPFEQVKFKRKRIPRDSSDSAVPVMHSPPRKITMADQRDWKIPPCISNWKNAKGFTIPLEMRLSADGRNLRNVIFFLI
jgi:SNW domain-containing protein 1